MSARKKDTHTKWRAAEIGLKSAGGDVKLLQFAAAVLLKKNEIDGEASEKEGERR
jgi:hypothetical protein